MGFSDVILQNLASTTLCGCARNYPCGGAQARGCGREQDGRETQRTLFPTAVRSSAGIVKWSPTQASVSPFDAVPLLLPMVVPLPPAS